MKLYFSVGTITLGLAMHTRERFMPTIFISRLWLTPAILALLLIIIAQSDFLSFHTMAQRFAVLISFVMFVPKGIDYANV